MLQAHMDQQELLKRVGMNTDFACGNLRDLGGLGTSGRHKNNVRKELVHLLGETDMPEPLCEFVPMQVLKTDSGVPGMQRVEFPVLLPHEVFAHLYHQHPCRF